MKLGQNSTGVLGAVVGYVFTAWIIRLLSMPGPDTVLIPLTALITFTAIPIGAFWMIYASFRDEEKPWKYVLYSFAPWMFVWYYFARTKPRSTTRKPPLGLGLDGRTRITDTIGQTEDTREVIQADRARDTAAGRRKHPSATPKQKSRNMLVNVGWFCLLLATTAFGVWVVFGSWVPSASWQVALLALFFAAHPVGALWMLVQSVRSEDNSLPFFFLAAVPYAFVWYYFERYPQRGQHG